MPYLGPQRVRVTFVRDARYGGREVEETRAGYSFEGEKTGWDPYWGIRVETVTTCWWLSSEDVRIEPVD